MHESLRTLLTRMAGASFRNVDRAVAVLWWDHRESPGSTQTVSELCRALESVGYPKQNVTRMGRQLKKDSRTRSRDGRIGVSLPAVASIEDEWLHLIGPTAPEATDSVIPREILAGTRGYLERILFELNASYDQSLYDCSAVMARRLVETLIIEVFESLGRSDEVRVNGEYVMLGGLIQQLEAASSIHIGRSAKKGLKELKALGDQSAHNRRFLARKGDIDQVRHGLRTAVEELAHLAGLT